MLAMWWKLCLVSGAFPLLHKACGLAIGDGLHHIANQWWLNIGKLLPNMFKVSNVKRRWRNDAMIVKWNVILPRLGQCQANAGPMQVQCWADAGPILGWCWANAGPVLSKCWNYSWKRSLWGLYFIGIKMKMTLNQHLLRTVLNWLQNVWPLKLWVPS